MSRKIVSAALGLLVLCAFGSALAANGDDEYVPEMHRYGLTRVFNRFNAVLDAYSTRNRNLVLAAALNPAAAATPRAAIYASIMDLYGRFAIANVSQSDRVWDSVDIPAFLAPFAPAGIISGSGVELVANALTDYVINNIYLGQYQQFGPLDFSKTGSNTFRVWCHVTTLVEKKVPVVVNGSVALQDILVMYFGEKVHDYIFAGNKYLLTHIDNGMRFTQIQVVRPNNLALPPTLAFLAPSLENHETVVANVLPNPAFDVDTVAA